MLLPTEVWLKIILKLKFPFVLRNIIFNPFPLRTCLNFSVTRKKFSTIHVMLEIKSSLLHLGWWWMEVEAHVELLNLKYFSVQRISSLLSVHCSGWLSKEKAVFYGHSLKSVWPSDAASFSLWDASGHKHISSSFSLLGERCSLDLCQLVDSLFCSKMEAFMWSTFVTILRFLL